MLYKLYWDDKRCYPNGKLYVCPGRVSYLEDRFKRWGKGTLLGVQAKVPGPYWSSRSPFPPAALLASNFTSREKFSPMKEFELVSNTRYFMQKRHSYSIFYWVLPCTLGYDSGFSSETIRASNRMRFSEFSFKNIIFWYVRWLWRISDMQFSFDIAPTVNNCALLDIVHPLTGVSRFLGSFAGGQTGANLSARYLLSSVDSKLKLSNQKSSVNPEKLYFIFGSCSFRNSPFYCVSWLCLFQFI